LSIIPTKFPNVPVERMHGRYRKMMKQCFHKELYNQRSKNETVLSVIKRMFGEHITSRRIGAQNRELAFRCIAYNMHRCERIIFVIVRGFLQSQGTEIIMENHTKLSNIVMLLTIQSPNYYLKNS